MKRSNRLILLIGVFLAVVAFVGIVVISGRSGGPGTPQTPTELDTVIAARDIPLGTPIQQDMVKTEKKATTSRDTTAFADTSLVIGKIARKPIATGKQLTADDFSAANAAAIDIHLNEGEKAISVEIDLTNGVAKLVQAGDYIDIVGALGADAFPLIEIDPDTGERTIIQGINSSSAKLVLQGMQVLGVVDTAPQTTNEQGDPVGPNAASSFAVLKVTAQQAEVIKYMQSLSLINGSVKWPISLVLRAPCLDASGNATSCPLDVTTGITLRTLVDEYNVLIPELVEAVLPEAPNP